jgi:hypothetical protein
MASRGLPKEWSTWNGKMASGHTEKQLTEMFVNGRPEGIKVHKIVIEPKPSGPLWDFQKDGFNNITERHCMQLVGVFSNLNGQFSFYQMGVRETHLGVDVDEKFISKGNKSNKK